MVRHVEDVAVALNVLAARDPADPATARAEGHIADDYTRFLDPEALTGARIGVARQFLGGDREVDWAIEAALATMEDAGAELVDVTFPDWLMDARGRFYRTIRYPEFKAQIADYLATLRPGLPRTLRELIDRSGRLTARTGAGAVPGGPAGARPNPSRWSLMLREVDAPPLTDPTYRAVRDHALPLLRAVVGGVLEAEALDAIVYPTSPSRPPRADRDPRPDRGPGSGESAVILANMTGFPDLIVPAGFTGRGLPVTISFLGPAFSEPRLLALGYAFEQRTRARRLPAATPPLPGETLAP
jgi:amidase